MNVQLIDADSVIPNLALMKISSYHKSIGDTVELIQLNLPFYSRNKSKFYVINSDKTYCSVIFKGNKDFIIGENIIYGGTGVDLNVVLPEFIEKQKPDYSIYPENNVSYGFITRGCIRNCSFCVVPQKEGLIHQVANVSDIIFHNRVVFLDNNILAYEKHKQILQDIIDKKIKCKFCQGLDIKLVDNENSVLLSKLNYWGEYFFAFDDWRYRGIIEEKLKLLKWRKPYQLRFYVYVSSNMIPEETINRVKWLRENKCLCYIMRDQDVYENKLSNFYTDLAAYCNQVNFYKKIDFMQFIEKRHKNLDRFFSSKKIWQEC